MPRKKIVNSGKAKVKELPFSDLYALYLFVSSRLDTPFKKQLATNILNERFIEVENELYERAYGVNPYKVEGQRPEEVIAGFPVPKKVPDNLNVTEPGVVSVNPPVSLAQPSKQVTYVKTGNVLEEKIFVVVDTKSELKDEKPQTFVVANKE